MTLKPTYSLKACHFQVLHAFSCFHLIDSPFSGPAFSVHPYVLVNVQLTKQAQHHANGRTTRCIVLCILCNKIHIKSHYSISSSQTLTVSNYEGSLHS